MLAPAGLLVTESVADTWLRWTTTDDLLPETTFIVRESVTYPLLLTVIECGPGSRLDTANGVTHVGSVAPSSCTCAPCGVESTVICPGTITGAATFFLLFLVLAERGASGSGSAAWARGATTAARVSGALCGALWGALCATGSGWAGAVWVSVTGVAGRADPESSSPLPMRDQSQMVTIRIRATAPRIE